MRAEHAYWTEELYILSMSSWLILCGNGLLSNENVHELDVSRCGVLIVQLYNYNTNITIKIIVVIIVRDFVTF